MKKFIPPIIGPTLETPRLILRPPQEHELDPWAKMMSDEDTARYIGGVMPRAMVWRAMAMLAGMWVLRGFGMFSVIEKSSGEWLGRIGPLQPDGWPGTEIGWTLKKEAQGKGYAVEAAIACMDFAVDELAWDEIIHCIDVANDPSREVAKKIGSTRLRMAKLPAPFDDKEVEVWGQTAAQWKARRAGLKQTRQNHTQFKTA